MNRELSAAEEELIWWMLEHGKPEAKAFIPQLQNAKATPLRCPCGCASINLAVGDAPAPTGALHIRADFIFGTEENLSGAFVFEKSGILACLELYGPAGDAPTCYLAWNRCGVSDKTSPGDRGSRDCDCG
jgi:hypothetical protein